MSRLENFDIFYNENKEKLYMTLQNNYPLNYKKGTEWADSQCDSESKQFAHSIIENTIYISFVDFIDELKQICLSYLDTIKKDKDFKYILILPYKIRKSNTWVSLLVYKYLKNIIDDIEYSITSVYNNTQNTTHKLYNSKIRCLVCDDCSYTGQQILEIVTFDTNVFIPHKKKEPSANSKDWLIWYSESKKNIDHVVDNININVFSVDIIIPYISTRVETLLSLKNYIRLSKNRVLFDTFINQININIYPQNIIKEFHQTFQYHDDISAIYFDHKIADAVSTFNKVYVLAPLFNCTNPSNSIKFIDNCESKKIPRNIDPYKIYIDIEQDIDACPPSFYKKIKYSFNNKLLNIDSNISLILD